MNGSEVIRARRSVRKFKSGVTIPRDHVERMLEAAMMAPSACNTRPWEFYVVESREIMGRLAEIHPYAQMLGSASLAIVVCARPEVQEGKCAGYWPLDCGAAVENLLLQAVELGYGTCWCGCWPSERVANAIAEALGAKSVPVALISVGAPDEAPAQRGHYDPGKVHWVK